MNDKESPMCRKVTCRKCGKATWSGCGQHAEDVLRGIPKVERCTGHDNEPATGLIAKLFRR
jgi:hypothetical protein